MYNPKFTEDLNKNIANASNRDRDGSNPNCIYNSQKTDLILNNLEDKQNLFNFDPDFDTGDVSRKKYFN